MQVLVYILVLFAVVYAIWLFYLSINWVFLKPIHESAVNPSVSIIIPFRNEEHKLVKCITSVECQNYDADKIQLILVNDHSEDSSLEILSKFKSIEVHSLPMSQKGKKAAITLGVSKAKHGIIITLDADVVCERNWLKKMTNAQITNNAHMVIGQVKYSKSTGFSNAIQQLEHFALTIIAGGTSKIKKPILCNGANLLFTKQIFEKVKGYTGNEHIASGDDIFLLNKINANNPEKIIYLKDSDAAVICAPLISFTEVLMQRVRWASKNTHNSNFLNGITGLLVLLSNLSWPFLGVLSLFNPELTKYFLFTIGLKCIIDFLLLFLASSFFRSRNLLLWVPVFFCFYPIELFLVITLTVFGKQKWKGRMIK